MYQILKDQGANLEVIFISSDHDEGSHDNYRRQMPWLSLPYEERERKAQLSSMFDVTGVPTLVLLDPQGRVINRNARPMVERGLEFPWAAKLVPEVDSPDEWPGNPAETPTLVLLAERAGGVWEKLDAQLTALAKEGAAAAPEGSPPAMLFMVSKDARGVGGIIRRMARLGEPGPRPVAVLLDLARDGSFYVYDGDCTADNLRAFCASFKSGGLQPRKGGGIETMTVLAHMNRPVGGGDENMQDINPWQASRPHLDACTVAPHLARRDAR